MSDNLQPPRDHTDARGSRVNLGAFWGGLVIFGIVDYVLVMSAFDQADPNSHALILAAGTVVVAAILWLPARSLSLGIATGYVLMTIVSGGACTLTFADPINESPGALVGLVLYPAALILSGIAGTIVYVVRRRRDGGP